MSVENVAQDAEGLNSGRAISARAFLNDEESRSEAKTAFLALGLTEARVEPGDIDTALASLSHDLSPRLLIVDIAGQADSLVKIVQLADACDRSTSLIFVGDRNDLGLYRDLRERGVADYFFKPLASEQLVRSCGLAVAGIGEAPASHAGKLVIVFGTHPGIGATTIAVSAAWNLSTEKKRRVVLLDLNLKGGDAALLLDVKPSEAARQALEHPERVDNLFLDRAVIHVNDRLDLLASLQPLDDPFEPNEDAILNLIAKLQTRYEYVVVDTPPWCDVAYRRMMELPGDLVVAADPSLLSAREIVRWREKIPRLSASGRTIWAVLSKAGAAGMLVKEDVTRAVGEDPDLVVPFDQQIARAAVLGLATAGESKAMRNALAPLLNSLTGQSEPARPSFPKRSFGR